MKKSLLVFIIMNMLPAIAYENYAIFTNSPFQKVSVQNSEIVSANPIYTIDNVKNTIIISPKKEGKTKIMVNFFDEQKSIDIKVNDEKILVKQDKWFKLIPIDNPPAEYEIIKPPVLEEN